MSRLIKHPFVLPAVLVIAAAAIFACAGSGGSGDVLAKVGDYDITSQELEFLLASSNLAYPSEQEEYEFKRNIIDTLIDNRLFIQGAFEKKIDAHEEIARVVAYNKNQFLIDILYDRHILSKVKVTPAELKDYWNNLESVVFIHHILLPTEDSAKAIFAKLKAGENYEQMAYLYSSDPGAKANRGALGTVAYNALVKEMAEVAFALDTGEIAPPFQTFHGWHIVKISEKKPNTARKPLETSEKEYEAELTGIKRSSQVQRFLAEMKEKYLVTVDSNTTKYILTKRDNLYPPQVLATLPRSDFDVKQLDRNERDLPLATWNGGQITLGEYLEETAQVDPRAKPSFDQYDSLATAIWFMRSSEFLAMEAIKEGVENEPRYKAKMKLFKELAMAEIMRNDSITVGLVVSDSAARAYYDAHLQEFTTLARIRVFEIQTSDQALAARLARSVKSLEEFREMAMQYTERVTKRASSGDLGYIDQKGFPELFEAADKVGIGVIGGPIVSQGKFVVFYVADKLPSQLKDYLDVKRDIVAREVNRLRLEAQASWLAQRKTTTKITVYEDRLKAYVEKRRAAEGGKQAS